MLLPTMDFQQIEQNLETKLDEVIPFEKQSDDLKKRLAKNNEAKMVIYNALPRKEYERIFMCNTAKEIWKTLLITHQGNSQVKDNKIDLLVQQYEQFVISEDESIDSAFARFNTIITSLKSLDEGYSSKNYVRKFLKALHPKWRAKVTAIEESKDLTLLSLDELIGNLKDRKESSDEDQLLKVKTKSTSWRLEISRSFSKRRGRFVRQPQNDKKTFQRSRDDKNGKSDRKCFRCGNPNHLIGECPKPPEDKNQKSFVGGSWSDSGEEDDEKVKNEMCLVAQASSEVCFESSYFSDENSSIDDLVLDNEYDKLCKINLKIITKNIRLKAARTSLEKKISILKEKVSTLEKNKVVDLECVKCHMLKIENEKLKEEALKICLGVDLEPDEWIKDSGCSKHMMGNRKLFSSYKAYNRGNVIFGSNLRGNIIGKGQICDNKCRVTFSEHDSEITKDGKVIGHANMRLIQSLASKELVRNLPKLKFDQHFCDACKIGKQAHASHKAKNIVSTTRCLELLHMYTWTRFLKDKTKAFDQFEIFSKKIQNQLGCTIVSIRTDHGREFDNEVQFGEFCNANGITHNFSAPRTPQSNGMVERKNRTLQEMSRTMLNEQSLPQKFWCNAVDTSTYILNRILIRAILGKTPYELLRGRKPTLDYFRVFGSKCFILNTKDYLIKFDPKSYEGIFLGYSQNSKAYIILNKHTRKFKEQLNVTFDETPPPSKTSPLVDDDLDEEEAIKVTEKKNLENYIEDESLEIDEIVNIKESRNHPLENVIGNLNQRTLRSQAQNQSNLFCFISTIKPKNVNKALGDESWIVAMQEKLNQFIANNVWELIPQHRNMTIIGTKWVFRTKLDENGIVSRNKARKVQTSSSFKYVDDIKFGSTCQDMCDEFAKIMHDEFEMSMMGELNFFLGLQIKQMEDGIFFNQSKYIKEMLKKFGLEESKPMKTPMSSDTKLTKDEECESVDSTKYQGMIGSLLYLTASRPDIMFSVCLCARFQEAPKTSHLEAVKSIFRYIKGTMHLGLWYPKGTDIETVVYVDSDHAGDYVDRKRTSGICMFVGCCLTSWFLKKQTALAISTTEAEYVSAGKACQQALWMKQALIDYDIRLDDVPIIFVEFECLLEINDQICPRFILEFYSQYQLNYSDEGQMFIEFVIQNQFFSYSLEEFAQILDIPCEGACVFTDKWSLDELAYGVPTDGPYQTNPPSPDDIISSIRIDREGQSERTRKDRGIGTRKRSSLPLHSSSAFDQPSPPPFTNDDVMIGKWTKGTLRASTLPPFRYVNFINIIKFQSFSIH
ncbi:retrovirus-related pol polyprotein from transposon TNT 1-94 [Tanacetum coccineum]